LACKGLPGAVYRTIGLTGHCSPDYEIGMITLGRGQRQIALAAGTHGDEPAGVEALVRFLEVLSSEFEGKRLDLDAFTITVLPCNNPAGLERGTRENGEGIDLNRRFGSPQPPAEAAAIQGALEGKAFELFADFHEDVDGEGVYLYEIFHPEREGKPIGRALIEYLAPRWKIDPREEIDGFSNQEGIISPDIPSERAPGEGLPLPVYLRSLGTAHCVTLETPTAFPFEDRVGIHRKGLEKILELNGVLR
jgi:hypothetical protein